MMRKKRGCAVMGSLVLLVCGDFPLGEECRSHGVPAADEAVKRRMRKGFLEHVVVVEFFHRREKGIPRHTVECLQVVFRQYLFRLLAHDVGDS